MFFTENKQILKGFVNEAFNSEDLTLKKRINISKEIIEFIVNGDIKDEHCIFSIENFGSNFIENIKNFDSGDVRFINMIYLLSYRFLCEFNLNSTEHYSPIENIQKQVITDIQSSSDELLKQQLNDITYQMPYKLLQRILNDENMISFNSFQEKVEEAEIQKEKYEKLKIKWDNEIDNKKSEVYDLKSKLDGYKIDLNFVALNKGFKRLFDKKVEEEKSLLKGMLGMGVLIMLPLIFKIYSFPLFTFPDLVKIVTPLSTSDVASVANSAVTSPNDFASVGILLSLLSLELILIYFFRIILSNYKSVREQIVQIELRQTLCEFIQSYTDYSKVIKENDNDALEKFENLIFSGIITGSDKLPSTFDGIDKLGSLIKAVKSKP